jgi:glycosyltransferase involved in cell wall biosynthesis
MVNPGFEFKKLDKNNYLIDGKEVIVVDETSNDLPMVSVTMITYNHSKFIKQAIEGVLMQQTNFKVVLVIGEDCSSDETREIVTDYQRKHKDKIILKLPQYNLAININSISNKLFCKGKYIAECEGDDYWIDPLKLQKQVDFLEKNLEYSMCFTHQIEVSKSGEFLKENKYENKIYTTADIVKGFIPGTQTMLLRNFDCLPEMLKKYIFSASGDRMVAYCSSFFGDLYLLPEFTAAYRRTGEGVWTSFPDSKKFIFSLEEFIKFHQLIGLPVNNEIVHAKINGAYPYLFRNSKSKFLINISQVGQMKRKYNIKSNFILYFFKKVLG